MEQNAKTEYLIKNKKSLKRSLLATLVLLVATVGIFAAQTYAYFNNATTSGDNRILTGELDVELIEIGGDGQGENSLAVPPARIVPGSSVAGSKVIVKNAGTLPVYVRVKIEKTILQAENEIPDGWAELVSCNFSAGGNSTDGAQSLWKYHDGDYYYIVSVYPGAGTTSLFDTVSFSAQMGNAFENSRIQLKVVCQSVQANGNSDDPLTAWGWPAEPYGSD